MEEDLTRRHDAARPGRKGPTGPVSVAGLGSGKRNAVDRDLGAYIDASPCKRDDGLDERRDAGRA
jgi:hypothetical protein